MFQNTSVRCSVCSKVYGSESNLRRHLRNFHKTGPLVKTESPETEISSSDLTRSSGQTGSSFKAEVPETSDAVKIETGSSESAGRSVSSGPKACPRCPFTTFDQFHLTVHLRKHTGEYKSMQESLIEGEGSPQLTILLDRNEKISLI